MTLSAAGGRCSLVEVQFTPGQADYDPEYANAMVFILALASSDEEYRALVLERLEQDGFFFVCWFEDVEAFDPDVNDWDDPLTREAQGRLSLRDKVQYVTFHRCHKSGLDS